MRLTAPDSLAGERLDRAICSLRPQGLRSARRLIERGLLTVNGASARPAQRLRGGETIELLEAETPAPAEARIAESRDGFVLLEKPAGMACAALAGGAFSVEDWLERQGPGHYRLLQRLDYWTSGLLLAAADANTASAWSAWQKEGRIRKIYLALLCGLPGAFTACGRIEQKRRRKALVLARTADGERRSAFLPLKSWRGAAAAGLAACLLPELAESCAPLAALQGLTLARVEIRRGARHQIRAHAAAAGCPLFGDELYNPDFAALPGARFFLRQMKIFSPAGVFGL